MAYITQYSDSVPVVRFPVDQHTMMIGQDISADICIPEDNLSDLLAQLIAIESFETYTFKIKVLDESQSVKVNGNVVTQELMLNDGDWIAIGETEFQFTDDGVNEITETPMQAELPENVIDLTQSEPEIEVINIVNAEADTVKADVVVSSQVDKNFSRRLRIF